jgi:hypothetical protein
MLKHSKHYADQTLLKEAVSTRGRLTVVHNPDEWPV